MAVVAAIIPARDEAATVGDVVRAVAVMGIPLIIVIDNGSSDATAAVAREAGAVVVSEPARGYGRACLRGIAALPAETEIVVFLDADASDDPSALPRLLAPILADRADLVVGRRIAAPGALTMSQRWGNALASRWLRLRFGIAATDLGPFRAVRRCTLHALAMRDRGYGWTVEMQIKAAHQQARYLEIPVAYGKRQGGRSKVSGTLRGTFGASIKILSRLLYHDVMSRHMAAARLARTLLLVIAAVTVAGAPPAPVMASGTYVGRPPLPPKRPDPVKYNRGKQLFNGEVVPAGPAGDREAQSRELRDLQAKLPPTAGSSDLTTLAGRLSAEELEALRYFLSVRFKVGAQ